MPLEFILIEKRIEVKNEIELRFLVSTRCIKDRSLGPEF